MSVFLKNSEWRSTFENTGPVSCFGEDGENRHEILNEIAFELTKWKKLFLSWYIIAYVF